MTDRDDLTDAFWAALDRVRTGLLAVTEDGNSHALPMTAHFDAEGPLFFFAPAKGRLAESLGRGESDATFYYAGPDHDLFATVHGSLSESDDAEARDLYWSPEVERWFPGQRSSDSVALLRFEPDEGEVWLPSKGVTSSRLELNRKPVDVHAEVDL